MRPSRFKWEKLILKICEQVNLSDSGFQAWYLRVLFLGHRGGGVLSQASGSSNDGGSVTDRGGLREHADQYDFSM